MASGMQSTPGIIGKVLAAISPKIGTGGKDSSAPEDKIARLGLSPRQQELNEKWSWYRCQQYAARKQDWDGKEILSPLDMEAVASKGSIPPGFYDAGAQSFPLKFRRPTAPYALVKVIVDRFTGLLFSENQHPVVRVDGDHATEDYLQAIVQVSRLWSAMIQARTHGGAMGTACVGFQFVEGKPVVEVHDPRWTTPAFADRGSLALASIDKRYQYPVEERDPTTGRFKTKHYWYRRTIDAERDVVFKPAEVADAEPLWEPEREVVHQLGFCPVVWVQNLPVLEDIDGDPDCCTSAYEMARAVDALLAQANRGVLFNCFGGETRFVTTRGVRAFADFCDGAEVQVPTHLGGVRRAIVRRHGKQSLWSVTLQRGTRGRPFAVRATREHRWLLSNGGETTSLEVGDRLRAAPAMFASFEYEQASQEERIAWCHGFTYGDGALYRNSETRKVYGCQLRLCGVKAAYASRFADCGYKVWSPEKLNGDVLARTDGYRKELLDTNKTDLNILRAFVRGYVDADASKSAKHSSRWHRIQVTGEEAVAFVREAFPAVGLYIAGEVDMTGTATNYGPRTAKTVRFSLNENTSLEANSEWRVVAVDDLGVVEDAWCLEVEGDRSFVLPCGVATGNCDPTLVITSTGEMNEIKKGSDNSLKVPNGSANYMEITGSGPKAAVELAELFRKYVLEMSQCVLEHPDVAGKTATEVERMYAMMLQKTDVMREQYGEKCVKPMLEMMFKAAQSLDTPRAEPVAAEEGAEPQQTMVRRTLNLPPVYEKDPTTGALVARELTPGQGGVIRLQWPGYFQPSLADVREAATAAAGAKTGGLIDDETAIKFLAPYFHVEDVSGMVQKVRENAVKQQAELEAMALGGGYGG